MYTKQNIIYLAGGCFWGIEAFISRLKGVNLTEVGYANGRDLAPTYEKVCSGKTGHVECVKVTYNPEIISLNEILENFYKIIDPYAVNRQGADIGSQYQSGIFWQSKEDKIIVLDFLVKKQENSSKKIQIKTSEISCFYTAEMYHQKYLEKHPEAYCHVDLNLLDTQEFDHLTPEEFETTQLALTEAPYSGKYNDFFEDGIYVDVVDGEVLFSSDDKYDSKCGWPSFTKAIDENAITKNRDFSNGTTRVEVRSKKANSHLGHVFLDSQNGGERYCINSAALKFIPKKDVKDYLKKIKKDK